MKTMVCLHCKSHGRPAKQKRGSNGLAVGAWMIFPIGLPYTLWRSMTKKPVCRYCGSDDIVEADSAIGKRILESFINDIANPTDAPPNIGIANDMQLPYPIPHNLENEQAEEQPDPNQMDLPLAPSSPDTNAENNAPEQPIEKPKPEPKTPKIDDEGW